jgi:hypothetical protein
MAPRGGKVNVIWSIASTDTCSQFTLTFCGGMLGAAIVAAAVALPANWSLEHQEHLMKTARLFLSLAILGIASSVSAANPPTAEELLTAFEKSVEKLARVQIDWDQKGRDRGNDVQVTILRDGLRWKVDRWLLPKGDPSGRGERLREQTLIGDEIVRVSLRYDATDDPPRLLGMMAICERVAVRSWLGLGHPAILFGRMPGDAGVPLWTIMRESGSLELLPNTEIIDGFETYIVESRGKFGDHQLWLDPANGGLPRRIEVHKHPGNLLNDEQLGTTTVPNPPVQPDPKRRIQIPVRRPRSESWVRLDNIQIENQKGVFVITGFEEQHRVKFSDDQEPKGDDSQKPAFKTEHRFRVVVDLPAYPEDAFKFAVAIPNGMFVSVLDKYPLEYQGPVKIEHEWMDGKIRKRVGD